jgi:hypothetical protein
MKNEKQSTGSKRMEMNEITVISKTKPDPKKVKKAKGEKK